MSERLEPDFEALKAAAAALYYAGHWKLDREGVDEWGLWDMTLRGQVGWQTWWWSRKCYRCQLEESKR